MEKTDSGNSCGSGCHAGRSIFKRDPAERIHRNRSGGDRGAMEQLKPLAGSDHPPSDGFLEDRRKEDRVNPVVARLNHLRNRVSRNAEQRRSAAGIGIQLPHQRWGQLAGRGSQMNPMRGGGKRNVGTRVDQQLRGGTRSVENLQNPACKGGKRAGREIFFAELDEVDAVSTPAPALVNKGSLPLSFVAREQHSVCDGEAQHACLSNL